MYVENAKHYIFFSHTMPRLRGLRSYVHNHIMFYTYPQAQSHAAAAQGAVIRPAPGPLQPLLLQRPLKKY